MILVTGTAINYMRDTQKGEPAVKELTTNRFEVQMERQWAETRRYAIRKQWYIIKDNQTKHEYLSFDNALVELPQAKE